MHLAVHQFGFYSISQEICTRFCFAVLCCGYTLTDFPISIKLTSLALWQSNDCPSASKATLMNMDKYFMWIHYERLHNHNKAKHNKTVCIFLGIYCRCLVKYVYWHSSNVFYRITICVRDLWVHSVQALNHFHWIAVLCIKYLIITCTVVHLITSLWRVCPRTSFWIMHWTCCHGSFI